MAKRSAVLTVSRQPRANCPACSGFGLVHMTAHFASGLHEFEWPCWECFGSDVRLPLPAAPRTEN